MGLFSKKTNYFDKTVKPACGYCLHGKRTKDGSRILCEKAGLMEEDNSCGKFVYSPLKRIPVKQLKNEGAVGDEAMYAEIKDEEEEAAKDAQADAKEAPAPAPAIASPQLDALAAAAEAAASAEAAPATANE